MQKLTNKNWLIAARSRFGWKNSFVIIVAIVEYWTVVWVIKKFTWRVQIAEDPRTIFIIRFDRFFRAVKVIPNWLSIDWTSRRRWFTCETLLIQLYGDGKMLVRWNKPFRGCEMVSHNNISLFGYFHTVHKIYTNYLKVTNVLEVLWNSVELDGVKK